MKKFAFLLGALALMAGALPARADSCAVLQQKMNHYRNEGSKYLVAGRKAMADKFFANLADKDRQYRAKGCK